MLSWGADALTALPANSHGSPPPVGDAKRLIHVFHVIYEISFEDFETFATTAYIYASQDLLEAAAAPSLFLILIASIFILFVSKYILSDN